MTKGEDGSRTGSGAGRKARTGTNGGQQTAKAASSKPQAKTGSRAATPASKAAATKAAAKGGGAKTTGAKAAGTKGTGTKGTGTKAAGPRTPPAKPGARPKTLRGPTAGGQRPAGPGLLARFGAALLARRQFAAYGLVGIALLVVAGAVIGSLITPARYEQVARPTLPAGAAVPAPDAAPAPAPANAAAGRPSAPPPPTGREWRPDLAGSGATITGEDASRESRPQAATSGAASAPVPAPAPAQTAAQAPAPMPAPAPTPAPVPTPAAPAAGPAQAARAPDAAAPQPPAEPERQVAAMVPPVPDAAVRPPEGGGMPAWQRFAIKAPAVPKGPRVAIVIDDMGVNKPQSAAAIALPGPITFAFLPYARDVGVQAAKAHAAGHELLVHMPMRPSGPADPGPKALDPALSVADNVARLKHNLDMFGGYVGINNHMGSRATESAPLMQAVMAELKARGLLFLDSRTTAKSVGASSAIATGIPNATRDIFLDHEIDEAKIAGQLDKLEAAARRHGGAIAIGHPHPETLRVLTRWLPAARARGIELVPLTALIPVPGDAGTEEPRTVADQTEAAPARAEEGAVFMDGPVVKE
ncbi:divergent polysaccharide deacetylase family protein [Tistrella bauzanensis]|uniref:divergent polysaccharide deacetylase family protein n=1 Tax=Tistrella TaxID=171436 RepID=UPI0031F5F0C6